MTSTTAGWGLFGLALCASCFVMCSSTPRASTSGADAGLEASIHPARATTPAIAGASSRVSSAIDLGAADVARLAFADTGDGFIAEAPHYAVHVEAGGAIRFVSGVARAAQHLQVHAGSGGFRFATTAIARGAVSFLRDDDAAHVEGSDVVVARRGVVERLTPTARGLEQRWEFAARPAGQGDLVLRVRVPNARHTAANASGDHFVDFDARARVRYGVATWIDAAGTTTPIATTFDEDTITLRVPEGCIERSPYPATLDPLIGPEQALDTATWTSTPETNGGAIAFDGTHYLFALQELSAINVRRLDASTGQPVTGAPPSNADVDGTFVSGGGLASSPLVGCDAGGKCLVVWTELRYEPASSRLYGALFDTNAGALLTPNGGVPILATGGNQIPVGVAFDGTHFAVLWQDDIAAAPGTYLARIDEGGSSPVVLDTHFVAAASTARLAYGAGSYLVVTDENNVLRARRVDPSTGLARADVGSPITLASGTGSFDVAFNGISFTVGWMPAPLQIQPTSIRVDASTGETIGSPVVGMDLGYASAGVELPATLAYDGEHVLFLYGGDYECDGEACGDFFASRIDCLDPATGAVLSAQIQTFNGGETFGQASLASSLDGRSLFVPTFSQAILSEIFIDAADTGAVTPSAFTP